MVSGANETGPLIGNGLRDEFSALAALADEYHSDCRAKCQQRVMNGPVHVQQCSSASPRKADIVQRRTGVSLGPTGQ